MSSSPAKCTVTERLAGEQAYGRLDDDLDAVVLAAIKHHLREDREIGRRAEQAGVAGYATQCVGVLIVDLAPQGIAAWRRDLCRSDAVFERVGGTIHRLVHPEGLEDASCQVLVERLASDDLDQESQNIGTQVGVDVLSAGAGLQRWAEGTGADVAQQL